MWMKEHQYPSPAFCEKRMRELSSTLRSSKGSSPNLRLAVTAGLCGGYSTLAAFAYENTLMLRAGSYFSSGFYMALTVVGSLLFFQLGNATANPLYKKC